MGIRFRKRVKIVPGLTLNINKKSVGVTAGVRGAHASINTEGQRTTSMGIPGTGLSYVDVKRVNGQPRTENETEEVEDSQNSFMNQTSIGLKIEAAKKLRAKHSDKALKRFSIIFRCFGVLIILMSLVLCLASLFALLFVGFGIFVLYLADFYSKMARGYYDNLNENTLDNNLTNSL
ncbi:MAG: DUF4236 domain-containing protein [Aminipila sp.]